METFSDAETYTLEDLENWSFKGVSLAVLGFPVRHSISPAMHNAAIAELARTDDRFSEWRYFRFEVPPQDLVAALPVFHSKGFFGLNLTVPHKELAIGALSEIDPPAREIGAVNTLRRNEEGYKGYNTDGYGLQMGIQQELQRSLDGANVVVLGAGGAGRAAAVQALRSRCQSLTLVNRNPDRLAKLLATLEPIARERSIPFTGFAPSEVILPEDALLINATSLGLNSDDPLPLAKERMPNSPALYDMIYNPSVTALMTLVRERGGHAANGLSMLVHQGARALEIWSDTSVSADAMHQAASADLEARP